MALQPSFPHLGVSRSNIYMSCRCLLVSWTPTVSELVQIFMLLLGPPFACRASASETITQSRPGALLHVVRPITRRLFRPQSD